MNAPIKPDPIAAALLRLNRPMKLNGCCIDFLLQELMKDAEFAATADRPHSSKELRDRLREKAVEYHQHFGIVLTIFDGSGLVKMEKVKRA